MMNNLYYLYYLNFNYDTKIINVYSKGFYNKIKEFVDGHD